MYQRKKSVISVRSHFTGTPRGYFGKISIHELPHEWKWKEIWFGLVVNYGILCVGYAKGFEWKLSSDTVWTNDYRLAWNDFLKHVWLDLPHVMVYSWLEKIGMFHYYFQTCLVTHWAI